MDGFLPLFTVSELFHVGEWQREKRWQGWNESSVLLTREEKNAPAANVVVWLRSYASWALIHRYLPLASFSRHRSGPLHSCSHSRAQRGLHPGFSTLGWILNAHALRCASGYIPFGLIYWSC